MSFGPACPNCKKWIPFLKSQWGIGKSFDCRGCGASIALSKFRSTQLAIGMLMLFILMKPSYPEASDQFLLFLAFLAVGAPLTYLLSSVSLSQPASGD
ncbi:hypothetical protein FJQ54_05595 [Sandaracinobacter neustonicus]|uniref:Uncharacterized protein n=1 Tax=Sandaracinobacter neustonicus TaxID=1715348 RepID=A0A501XQ47_9SPHN|nr:hypothetical protein [Sandaracinobacter neustonicus]TPE62660.1 hypothetical protein FJQ54_05595 [Sandaracinobacter neustonicus]